MSPNSESVIEQLSVASAPDTERPLALNMSGVCRKFGPVVALDDVSLQVSAGTIHAVVGENGAGKSTLLKVAYGEVRPDAGQLAIEGHDVGLARFAPRVAIGLGVGMVHQHFMLVDDQSVLENVVLGNEPRRGWRLDLARVRAELGALADSLGVELPLERPVGELAVGDRQRVELIKVLWRGARVLILDEPTAVLTPLEVASLFSVLGRLRDEGRTIVLVTHKLDEVAAFAQGVTVLRSGKNVARFGAGATPEELARAIMGSAPGAGHGAVDTTRDGAAPLSTAPETPDPPDPPDPPTALAGVHSDPSAAAALPYVGSSALHSAAPATTRAATPVATPAALALDELTVRVGGRALVEGVSLDVAPGEIVGIAGIEGNGQRELIEAIAGLVPYTGSVRAAGRALDGASTRVRLSRGLGHVPEDRQRRGLVLDFSVQENLALGRGADLVGRALWNKGAVRALADSVVAELDVRPADPTAIVAHLSGGNQQKVVVGRELARPGLSVLLCAQPTRGVDIGAAALIHERLRAAAARGVAILLVSSDLHELRALSQRILVLYKGRIRAALPVAQADDETLGLYMTGART